MNVPEKHREVAHKWVDGAEIEMRRNPCSENWTPTLMPDWDENLEYRVRPRKPSIDWSHVRDHISAMATDPDGNTWLYSAVPEIGNEEWTGCTVYAADIFPSFRQGTCDWRDSLVVRPGHTEE